MMSEANMLSAMKTLLDGQSLSRQAAEAALNDLLGGSIPPERIGAFLLALRMKHETAEEISGFVDCMNKRGIKVQVSRPDVMDICGTGGDSCGTFNVSTVATFVLAAAGQPIAKHGNRSISSKSGSFDVFEALGLDFDADPEKAENSIEQHGIGLLFAPAFQPDLKSIASIRKNLGTHTIFNALGPLLNPARVKRQLIGVYSPLLLDKMALVLKAQGSTEAMIVRGNDGLDEISLSGPTQVAHLKEGKISRYILSPEDFNLSPAPLSAIQGGTAEENAKILIQILRGEKGPKRDIVVMNASAALCIGGKATSLKEGVAKACEAIDSGRALELLKKMGGSVE
jgi:anthranilate phosphoribosyltransferase